MRRSLQLCGELKTKVRPLVEVMYGFDGSNDKEDIARNRRLAEMLLDNANFVASVRTNSSSIS